MKKYFKPVLSVIGMAVFFIMAWACKPDPKANDCNFLMPSVTKSQSLHIVILDVTTKKPIPSASLDITSYYKYKVKNSDGCQISTDNYEKKIVQTDNEGKISFGFNKTYYSKEDIIKILFEVSANGYYPEYRNFEFYYTTGNLSPVIYLLKKNNEP